MRMLATSELRMLESAEAYRNESDTMSQYPSSFDRDDLLKCARGELFGPGNAQLPEPPMLMMDRITEISEDGGEHGKGPRDRGIRY